MLMMDFKMSVGDLHVDIEFQIAQYYYLKYYKNIITHGVLVFGVGMRCDLPDLF